MCLAFRTEVAAAISDRDALDRCATHRTEVTTKAVGNLELKVGGARLAARSEIVLNAGSLIVNS